MSHLEKAFRELRDRWFYAHLYSRAHERDWEDEEKLELREEQNTRQKKDYDQETDDIVSGKVRAVAPRCVNDMIVGRQNGSGRQDAGEAQTGEQAR